MKTSKKYWKKIKSVSSNASANASLFRFLGSLNFNIKKKNILEIGFGAGSDLIEMLKRGGYTYGLDINKKFVNKLKPKIKNLKCADCIEGETFFENVKFNLIYHRDLIYYLDKDEINDLNHKVFNSLKKRGIYVFQYVEDDLIKKIKNSENVNFDLNFKKQFKIKKFAEKNNPIRFLKYKFLLENCKKNNFEFLGKKILIESYDKNERKIRVNRYLAFKK